MLRISKKFWEILSQKQKMQIIPLIVMMLVGGLMESLSVSLILPLISAIMASEEWSSAWYAQIICTMFNISTQKEYIKILLLILIGVFIVKNMYLLFEYYVQYTFILNGRYNIQKNLMEIFMHKSYNFFLNASTGEILRIVANDTGQAFNLLKTVLSFYTELIVGVVLAITVFIVSPSIAMLLGVSIAIEMFIIAKMIKPLMKRMGDRQRAEGALANKWFLQAYNGIKSIKVENREDYFCENYSKHVKILLDADKKSQILSNMPRLIIEACTMTIVFSFIGIMIDTGMPLENIIPQLSAIAVAAMRLLPSVNRISAAINDVPFSEGGLDNLIKTMHSEDERGNESKLQMETFSPEISFNENIALEKVVFSYDGTDKKILDNADLVITKGQSIGVVGVSGAGKTTAIDIILGLLKPQAGAVFVDGNNIETSIISWRKHISYIPQQIFLMDDTIRGNIAFGQKIEDIDDEAIWEALKEAQLDEFVGSLPEGLDTYVGEQGVRISGGQRQRIGIARALYRNPDIIVFDEATSALDGETEKAIMESIERLKGKKTLIIIAHRLSTIENCDIVYAVKDGKFKVRNK